MKKKILFVVMLLALVLSNQSYAKSKTIYEVPVQLMHYSIEGQKSMAGSALKETATVVEENGQYTFNLKFKAMEFNNLKGNITNLFILDKNETEKIEASKKDSKEEYPIEFSFTIDSKKDAELVLAVWVDVMDQMSGGNPGAGEQKAKLKVDWNNAKIQGESTKKEVSNTSEYKIKVNGKLIPSDVALYNENGRILVPVRMVSEALGSKVEWDGENKVVSIDESIKLSIGSKEIIKKDGSKVQIDTPAQIKNERTFVPIRAIAEILGCEVQWDGNENTVIINK